MDYANQMILQRYELISACIDKNYKGYSIYKPAVKELYKSENKLSNEVIDNFFQIYDALMSRFFLLDDVHDNTKLRNGKPTAHRLYGKSAVINCCLHTDILTFKKLANLFPLSQQSEVLKKITKKMVTLCLGQGMDLYWRDTAQCPTEKQYMDMIEGKAGHGFALTTDVLSLYTGYADKYSKLSLLVGTYVQFRNDYVNLKSQKYVKSKGFCEDITEGKFALPMIHAITSNPQDTSLLNILKQRTEDIDLKKHFLNCLEKSGSLEYTWKKAIELVAQIKEELARLGGMPCFEEIIEGTLDVDKPFF